METLNWKPFNIVDLFDVKGGKFKAMKDCGDPIYPYVSSTSINNGVSCMCNDWNYENIIGINSNGSVGYAFWHPYKCYLNDACTALTPKFNITDNIALFLCIVLTNTFTQIYDYNKKLYINKLKQEFIYLPAKDDVPDWEWIDQYMESIKPVFNE